MPLGNPIRKQNESRMVSVLATEGQTVFTVQGGYIINHISVFRNGVRLSPAEDFTAGDGSTVTLNDAANVEDRIDFHIFDRFTVQNAIIGAASTQTINGDLVLNGKLFGALDVPSINLTGIVTATKAIIGTGVTIDQSNIDTVGIITATTFKGALTGAATRVTLTDQTGDTSCNVLFSQSATGDQLPHTNANLTYNSSSGALTATSVNGNIVGGTVSGTTGTFSGDVDIADKIIHTGDTDTTIRFPEADTIRFDTGGTEAARINSSQKLIIGDTNSDAQLGVYRASYNIAEFCNTNADATGAEVALRKDSSSPADGDTLGMLKFLGDNDAGQKTNYAYIQSKSTDVSDGSEDGRLEFYTRGAGTLGERIRITSTGKIGVNITSPNAEVDIVSSVEDSTGTLSAHGVRLAHVGATDEEVIPITAGFLTQVDRARAGIGFISKISGSSEGYGGAIGFYTRNTADGNGLLRTDERMRVREWGDVNIANKLNVVGVVTAANVTSSGTVLIDTTSYSEATSDADDIIIGSTSDTQKGISIVGSTSGGIGNIYFTDGVGYKNQGRISYHHADDSLRFQANVGERMRITSTGLVGVGQISPSFTMDLKRAGTDIIRMNNSGETTHGNADAKLVAGGTYYQNMDFHAYLYKFQTYNGSSLGERLRLTHDGKMGLGTGTPADAFHIHYGTDPSLNLFSTQHTQNTGSKINFGVGQSASSGGNTATRIESNIPSAGGAMTGELKFYTNNGDSLAEAVRIEKIGQVLGKASFVSKTTAVYNANVSTASGFTADAYNIVLAEDVLTNHSVYIVNFSWNHDGSGQPYLIDGAFVFQPGATNPGSAGAMGPGFAPVQGAHTEQGTSKYFNFRYYSPTGSHVHGLQAASTVSLNDTYGRGYLQIKIFQIGAETTI